MNKIILSSILLATLALADSSIKLQDTSIGGQVGLGGVGLTVKGKFSDSVGIRAGFDKFSVDDYEITEDEVKYNFDLNLQDFFLLADYHPWESSFKVSGGVIINGSELDGEITPATKQEFEFQGHKYSTDDIAKVNTTADFDPVAPYLGIGWDTSFVNSSGWGLTFDLGVAFQGSASVDYDVRYKELEKTGDVRIDAIAKDERDKLIKEIDLDLAKEKKSLQDNLDDYKVMPYISLGINYKF